MAIMNLRKFTKSYSFSRLDRPRLMIHLIVLYIRLRLSDSVMSVFVSTPANLETNEENNSCPMLCRCFDSTDSNGRLSFSVTCIKQNLDSVPQRMPSNLTNLYLSINNLAEITDKDFVLYNQMRILDLSFNKIVCLSNSSFSSFLKLEELYLNDNILTMTQISVPVNVFDNLGSLRVLALHNNNISEYSYRDDLYVKLKLVQTLSIDGICRSIQLGKGFNKLKSLKILLIYGQLCGITNNTFANLAGLPIDQLIIKTGPYLRSMEPDSFAHFQNMTILDLGLNREIMTIVRNASAWYGLRNTSIKSLILTRVTSDSMYNVQIPEQFFLYLNETKIENLLLDKNNIGEFSQGISQYLPHLKHWDMSHNRLSLVLNLIEEFRFMKEVVYIDVSQQQQRYEGPNKRAVPEEIVKINISELQSSEVLERHARSTATKADICKSKAPSAVKACPPVPPAFEYLPPTPVEPGKPWCIHFPPKLESFNLSASLSVSLGALPQISAFGANSLRETIYSFNRIQYLTGPIVFYNPNPNISYILDLSDNSIECIYEDFLRDSILNGLKLTNLYLSRNFLRTQLEEDIYGRLFQQYTDIVELRLDGNHIRQLSSAVFHSLNNIETLNLSSNALDFLSFGFNHMTKLSSLDLSYNSLTNIDASVLEKLDVLMKSTNLSLNLYGNKIDCTCDTLNLLTWMYNNAERIVRYNEYTCAYKNSTNRITKVVWTNLISECEKNWIVLILGLAIGGAVAILFMFSVLIGIIIYRRVKNTQSVNDNMGVEVREQATSHRVMFNVNSFLTNIRIESGINSEIECKDAFVICAHEDDDWVKLLEENLGQLSRESSLYDTNRPRFNFYIHKYDFTAGKLITDNIDIAIKVTRKKILVLSKHFIKSNWCAYEFQRVLHRDINTGTHTIIPVVIESMSDITDKMSASLRDICSRTTYLEWPRCSCTDCFEHVEFWRKLSDALLDRYETNDGQQ